MLNMIDARKKAESVLAELGKHIEGGLAIRESETVTKAYGWIFFYNSRRYVETGDLLYAVAGNGPLVILAETGEAVTLGAARPLEEEIALFERKRQLVAASS